MNSQPSTQGVIVARLAAVRQVMKQEGIDALLVPSADPHLSEYLPGYWQGREWLSGFQGSVGTLIVTSEFAGLWADSRYWEQAEKELAGSSIELVKLQPGKPGPIDWLADQTCEGQVVAVDGAVMALASARQLEERLRARNARLHTSTDLLARVWLDRPSLPGNAVFEHLPPEATVSRSEKLTQLRKVLRERGADWHFIATLDDIAWLFNLRGSDVSYNPVFVAFALISQEQAILFVAPSKVDAGIRQTLAVDGVELRDYAQIHAALAAIAADGRLLIDPARVTRGLIDSVSAQVRLVEGLNPTTLAKSQKTCADLLHIRNAMEQDGAALCNFFSWLDGAWGRQAVTELTVDEQLSAARAQRPEIGRAHV